MTGNAKMRIQEHCTAAATALPDLNVWNIRSRSFFIVIIIKMHLMHVQMKFRLLFFFNRKWSNQIRGEKKQSSTVERKKKAIKTCVFPLQA